MYKNTSKNNQGRVDRGLEIELRKGNVGEALVGDEKLEMLRKALREMDLKIMGCSDPKERKRFGINKQTLQIEISKLRKSLGKYNRTGVLLVFEEVAKRVLPMKTYDELWDEARRLYDMRHKKEQEEAIAKQLMEIEHASRKNDSI